MLSGYHLRLLADFTSSDPRYDARVVFALFVVILVLHGLVNAFSSRVVAILNTVSVWWHIAGVAAIIAILAVVPSHHASIAYVFGHTANATGFGHGMYWFYVLPLGFLLTMYTITGYAASANISEETHGAEYSAARGVWQSVFYSASIGWIVLLALTFAVQRAKVATISAAPFPAIAILQTALTHGAANILILISAVGQLFCGMACVTSASRMVFAFARDRAIPGHVLWRRLSANKTPIWGVAFVIGFAAVLTLPALFPNAAGYPVAFFAVTSMSVVGQYIAYAIPVYLRWRAGDAFLPGPWTLGRRYKWINAIAVEWVGAAVVVFCLPTTPAGVFWSSRFSWSAVNYAPLVTIPVMLAVTIWYLAAARRSFTGPARAVDDASSPA